MDLMAPYLATDSASPRITTYTDAGRMELSAATAANWAAKGGNLMSGELGLAPGDVIAVDCPTDWLPAALVLGCWRAGVAVCSLTSPAADQASALIISAEHFPDSDFAADFDGEVLLVSADPFGRGVAESGGVVPFGVTDLAPELRVQGDRYSGPPSHDTEVLLVDNTGRPVTAQEMRDRASVFADEVRTVFGPWHDTDGLIDRLLPLFIGGSVVLSTDATQKRLDHLATVERGQVVV